MRQFTTPEQTAELIELGFEKPKSIEVYRDGHCVPFVEQQWAYSIGELIEMLPTNICEKIWAGDEIGKTGVWWLRISATIGVDGGWDVSYERPCFVPLYQEYSTEIIDALFSMILTIKERRVI